MIPEKQVTIPTQNRIHRIKEVLTGLGRQLRANYDIIAFNLFWFVLLFEGRSKLFRDPGTFFHTAAGEYILQSRHLIHRDPFSFTMYGKEWIAHQWLGECFMAFVHRLGGLDGLLVATCFSIALLYSWITVKLCRAGINPVLGMLLVCLALAASSHHLHVRPHLITIIALAIVYGKLCDVEENRSSIVKLYTLIPLFIVWTNIHGGVLGGLLTMFIVFSGWSIASLTGIHTPIQSAKDLALLWLVGFACAATVFINPYGISLPGTWFSIIGSSYIRESIQEHASVLTLLRHGDVSAFLIGTVLSILGILYIGLVSGTPRDRIRITWLIPLLWLMLSLSSNRHGPLFAATLMVAIADIYPHVVWVQQWSKKGINVLEMNAPKGKHLKWPIRMTSFLAIAVGTLLTYSLVVKPVLGSDQWVTLDKKHWPLEHVVYLQKYQAAEPSGTPVFNDMLFGGFLIYYTPGMRVFIDDRWELYEDNFISAYIHGGPNEFKEWERKYSFRIALVEPHSNYFQYLSSSESWKAVLITESAVLYRKTQ
jgi:hypothetical protein